MKTPFGNSSAAIKLAQMVENDPKARSYVGSTIQELNRLLGQLYFIHDLKTRRNLCNIVRHSYEERIEKSAVDSKVGSFLKNVVVAYCRNFKRYVDSKA